MKIRIKRRASDLRAGSGVGLTKSDRNTIIRATGTGGGGGGYTEGAASDVVGSDGKLLKAVRHSTYAAPSAYPTELRAVNTGRTVRADATGLSVEGSTMDFRHDPVTGVGGWFATNKVEIDESLLTHDLTLREIDVCDSGVPKQMLILGSAPY